MDLQAVNVEITTIKLEPGDVLVVKVVDRHLTKEVADRFRAHLQEYLPAGTKVLLIDGNVELSKLTTH